MQFAQRSIPDHIDTLVNQIGCRMAGTPGNLMAAKYIQQVMERSSLLVEVQAFDCPAWDCVECSLTLAGKDLMVLVNPFTPSCDVEGIPQMVCTLAELEVAEITGKIVLLYGDLSHSIISGKSWFLIEERDKQIIGLLEQKQPAAILAVQANPASINRIFEDWEFHLPSVTVPVESALAILTNPQLPVHLKIKSEEKSGKTANVVGRLPGKRPEWITLMAHYDTKIDTPGACDNGTGVAALLALAEYFGRHRPEVGLEFVAFTNEEYLPIGDDEYLRLAGDDYFQQVKLAVNFDGVGFIADATTVAIYSSSTEFIQLVQNMKLNLPSIQWVDPWLESNHSTFTFRGVPGLAFSSRAADFFAHQWNDSTRWVSPEKIAEAVDLTIQVVQAVQNKSLTWLRETKEQQEK